MLPTTPAARILCAAILLCICLVKPNAVKAQSYAVFGSTPSEIIDNGSGYIGIGAAGGAKLHVRNSGVTDPILKTSYISGSTIPDYHFIAEHVSLGAPPLVPNTYTTDFIVNSFGHVGIGTGVTTAVLNMKDRSWQTSGVDLLLEIKDAADVSLMQVANVGSSGDPGLSMGVYGKTNQTAFGVFSASGAKFNIRGDGRVGINVSNANAALQVESDGSTGWLMNAGSKLMVADNGETSIIPASAFTGRALTVHGVAVRARSDRDVFLDLIESQTSNWNAQLRWLSSTTGLPRHIISDVDGNLHIDAGYGGGANNMLVVAGELKANNKIRPYEGIDLMQSDPDGVNWYNVIGFRDGTSNAKQVLCNVGDDLILYLNPFGEGSGLLKVAGNVQIGSTKVASGSHNDAKLFVDGKIAAKHCVVTVQNWADTVFAPDYELMQIKELAKYITTNKHLPEIPAEAEVLANGIEVGDMNRLLLKKIEELTLYTIQQQQQINKLAEQVDTLLTK